MDCYAVTSNTTLAFPLPFSRRLHRSSFPAGCRVPCLHRAAGQACWGLTTDHHMFTLLRDVSMAPNRNRRVPLVGLSASADACGASLHEEPVPPGAIVGEPGRSDGWRGRGKVVRSSCRVDHGGDEAVGEIVRRPRFGTGFVVLRPNKPPPPVVTTPFLKNG